MKHYDFIFAGGGLSGTLLLYLFLQSSAKNRTFLLIDKNLRKRKFRQWSFWMNRATPFDTLLTKQWKKYIVQFSQDHKELQLQQYAVSLLESDKYYAFMDTVLSSFKNVDCIEDEIADISSKANTAIVTTSQHRFTGSFVFDSTYAPVPYTSAETFFMQGLGMAIKTTYKAFDPSVLTFFDFRVIPERELAFFYVMPCSERFAFIDLAHFTKSNDTSLPEQHEALMHTYITKYLGIKAYDITYKKFEKIPLHEQKVERLSSDRVLKIGAKGGLIKSTTSYGFVNIFKDSKSIVNEFSKTGHIRNVKSTSPFHTLIDDAMLELMQENPMAIKQMYKELFTGVQTNGDAILAYLNEELSVLKSLQLITKVNPKPMAEIFQKRVMRKYIRFSLK